MATEVARTSQFEIVAGMYESIQAGDIEAALDRMHPDIVLHEADSIPFYGGEHTGRDAFRENVVGPMFGNYELEIHDVAVHDAGEVVVVQLDLTFTSRTSGKSVRMPVVEVSTVTDGLVSHMDVYYKDSAAMAATFPEGIAGEGGA